MKQFALDLIKTHGKEKALKLAQSCLQVAVASKASGGVHHADELEAMKKRKPDPKPARLHKTVEFWRQTADIIKKS